MSMSETVTLKEEISFTMKEKFWWLTNFHRKYTIILIKSKLTARNPTILSLAFIEKIQERCCSKCQTISLNWALFFHWGQILFELDSELTHIAMTLSHFISHYSILEGICIKKRKYITLFHLFEQRSELWIKDSF